MRAASQALWQACRLDGFRTGDSQIVSTDGGELADQVSRSHPRVLVAGMRVDGCGQRTGVPSKTLRQKQILRRPIDVRHRRVAQAVERVQPIEPRPLLPLPPREVNPAAGEPALGLGAEQGSVSLHPLTALGLEIPEPHQLWHELVGQEYVAGLSARGDLAADADPSLGHAVVGEDIADVESNKFD